MAAEGRGTAVSSDVHQRKQYVETTIFLDPCQSTPTHGLVTAQQETTEAPGHRNRKGARPTDWVLCFRANGLVGGGCGVGPQPICLQHL